MPRKQGKARALSVLGCAEPHTVKAGLVWHDTRVFTFVMESDEAVGAVSDPVTGTAAEIATIAAGGPPGDVDPVALRAPASDGPVWPSKSVGNGTMGSVDQKSAEGPPNGAGGASRRRKRGKTTEDSTGTAKTAAAGAGVDTLPVEGFSNGFVEVREMENGASLYLDATHGDDHNSYLCSVCEAFAADDDGGDSGDGDAEGGGGYDGGVLLCCDGPCLRSFHLRCIEIDEVPEDDYICSECQTGSHPCFACGQFGAGPAAGSISKEENVGAAAADFPGTRVCSDKTCGKFYHAACIRRAPGATSVKGSSQHFLCPRHVCSVCEVGTNGKVVSGKRSAGRAQAQCLRCPTAYHVRCMPPSAVRNELVALCSEHCDQPLPSIPMAGDDSELEATMLPKVTEEEAAALAKTMGMEGDLIGALRLHAKLQSLRRGFEAMPTPKRPAKVSQSRDQRHYHLPLSVLREVESRPPQFEMLRTNRYVVKPPARAPAQHNPCGCKGFCADRCINRLSRVECVGKPKADVGPKGRAVTQQRTNCSVGPGCGNRTVQERKSPGVQPFKTIGRGWGLYATEDIHAKGFVIEYCGEIIDEDEQRRRIAAAAERGEHDAYFMELGKGLVIDARFKANLSRFINHSCEPNCELQRWTIGQREVVAVFTRRPIKAGEELSYDYAFFTASNMRCLCGAKRCRGVLGKNVADEHRKSLAGEIAGTESRSVKRTFVERRVLGNHKTLLAALAASTLTSEFLPGDPGSRVASGPLLSTGERSLVRRRTVFLVRNLGPGSSFGERAELMRRRTWKRIQRAEALGGAGGSGAPPAGRGLQSWLVTRPRGPFASPPAPTSGYSQVMHTTADKRPREEDDHARSNGKVARVDAGDDSGGATDAAKQTLVVWDFDWTMVDQNSDTWVVEQLDPELCVEMKARCDDVQWTQLMDQMFGELHRRGKGPADVARAMSTLPMWSEVQDVIPELHARGATQIVLSDANTVLIRDALAARKLTECFDAVITNPAEYDEHGRLHVRPHQAADAPHKCVLCPVNQCKGSALDDYIAASPRSFDRIVYIGDGRGDFCPATRLRDSDVLCVRSGSQFKLNRLVKAALGDDIPHRVQAKVLYFDGGESLQTAIRSVLAEAST